MTNLQLSPRLAAVAELIPPGALLADVGTDHAYLPVWLLRQGQIPRAVVTDLRTGPLDHARRTAREQGVVHQMEFRLCDGLRGVAPGECDTISIAGMGGETIVGILAQAPWTKERSLILQPQSTQNVLRRWLIENGYCIRSERVAREGDRWYVVLQVAGGSMSPLTPGEEMAGRPETWLLQPERRGYLAWLLGSMEKQREGLRRSAKPEDGPRLRYLDEASGELSAWIPGTEGETGR